MGSKLGSSKARRRYRAVIFDFEGTLVDFQWRLAPAEEQLRRAYAELGFHGDEFSTGNYAAMWNTAADLLAPRERMAELRETVCPIYDRWDSDALARWRPRPGAADMLGQLIAGGIRVGMVSNIGRVALTEALGRFGLGGLLMPVISRDDVTYMKPRAEGILRVLADWQLAADKALFVGDSLADVRGARAADVSVAIIRGGEAAETAFSGDQPDHMISDLGELVELAAA